MVKKMASSVYRGAVIILLPVTYILKISPWNWYSQKHIQAHLGCTYMWVLRT